MSSNDAAKGAGVHVRSFAMKRARRSSVAGTPRRFLTGTRLDRYPGTVRNADGGGGERAVGTPDDDGARAAAAIVVHDATSAHAADDTMRSIAGRSRVLTPHP